MLRTMFLSRLLRWISVAGIALCFSSCQNEVEEGMTMDTDDCADIRFHIIGAEAVEVRSMLGDESIEMKITDATLASYDSDGQLVDVLYHENAYTGVSLYLSGSKENDVYALVNMGDMTEAFPLDEADLGKLSYRIESYDEISRKGIPMCGVARDCIYKSGKSVQIPLERLLSKLNARILHTDLTGSDPDGLFASTVCNKSIWLRQANSRLMPFAAEGSRAEIPDDILAVSDFNPELDNNNAYEGHLHISQLGPGVGYFQDTTVVLYVPENVQGRLLPDNDDPFEKTADKISELAGKGYDALCTYLELNVNKPSKGDGFGGDVAYRCYLGSDNVSDFSIVRNACYDLTISLTDKGFHLDNWKVVRGDSWTDVRTLQFVDEPYVIYPGTENHVILHYNRVSSSAEIGSYGDASELVVQYDAEAMAEAGLSCQFMGNERIAGKNGFSDFYFKVTAEPDAKTGVSFPIIAETVDGVKSDAVVLRVAEIGDLIPIWEFQPEYVSQTGMLRVAGAVAGLMPLSVTVADPSILKCAASGQDSFKVTALRPGATEIRITNKDGSQAAVIQMKIAAPVLRVSELSVALNPDGETASLDYMYLDDSGAPLSNVDEDVYRASLMPVVSGSGFISAGSDMTSVKMQISALDSGGEAIPLGEYRDVYITAADCVEVEAHHLGIFFVDPFGVMPAADAGRIDDYTLLLAGTVPSPVREYFENLKSSSEDLKYEVPQLKSDPLYISASLTPLWEGDFSYKNEVFRGEYSHSDQESSLGASVSIVENSLSESAKHGVGRHKLALNVKNRHSGEMLSRTVAYVDVYVHTAIGATASFGNFASNYPSGGSVGSNTVACIYNNVAGANIYTTTSSDRIYYMDVAVDFLTDVSNVMVFNAMRQGVDSYRNVLNGLDLISPSVQDGQRSSEVRMMYSVCSAGGERVGICGEAYGLRKGIGSMLYRALAIPARSMVMPEHQLKTLLLGYNVANGAAASPYAPCYEIHDMNLGPDMKGNTVSKYAPLYFSPVLFNSYRDASGRGYHVIHTLEFLVPRTCGWVNLL